MADIKIPIPELEQILSNQERMMQMLKKLLEAPTQVKYDEDKLMSGPEILNYLRCGRAKLKKLVEQGVVQKTNAFGARPLYKIMREHVS